jgi:hypothetical protein
MCPGGYEVSENPTVETLHQIAQALGITLDDLMKE